MLNTLTINYTKECSVFKEMGVSFFVDLYKLNKNLQNHVFYYVFHDIEIKKWGGWTRIVLLC